MAVFINVKVVPQSSTQKCSLEEKDPLIEGPFIKYHLKSPPTKGQANTELIKLISKTLKIPQFNIKITSGTTSKRKKIKIETNLTKEEIINLLIGK